VNVYIYEGKAGMVYLQVKLRDPCLSALRYIVVYKMALYKYSSFPFLFLCNDDNFVCEGSRVTEQRY